MRKPLCLAAFCFLTASAQAKEPSPSEVATRFYFLANEGKCSEAEALFTTEAVQRINATPGSSGGFAQFCKGRGGRAGIARLRVRQQERKGKHAEVMIERWYQDGSMAFERDVLVKVDGKWKLSIGESPGATGRR
jgi:Domain of unknown function (DUF4878)